MLELIDYDKEGLPGYDRWAAEYAKRYALAAEAKQSLEEFIQAIYGDLEMEGRSSFDDGFRLAQWRTLTKSIFGQPPEGWVAPLLSSAGVTGGTGPSFNRARAVEEVQGNVDCLIYGATKEEESAIDNPKRKCARTAYDSEVALKGVPSD